MHSQWLEVKLTLFVLACSNCFSLKKLCLSAKKAVFAASSRLQFNLVYGLLDRWPYHLAIGWVCGLNQNHSSRRGSNKS